MHVINGTGRGDCGGRPSAHLKECPGKPVDHTTTLPDAAPDSSGRHIPPALVYNKITDGSSHGGEGGEAMRRKVLACLLSLAIAVTFMPVPAFAATKSMTAYDEVIKDGNTVYCCTYGGIYKVKLKKNGHIKSKKRLVAGGIRESSYPTHMKKKGGYIYFIAWSEGVWSQICRVKISSGKEKALASGLIADYAISGSKIYYALENEETGAVKKRVMKLNGKSKKKTKTKVRMKHKASNAKGYRIVQEDRGSYCYYWLKTPKGREYIGRASSDW